MASIDLEESEAGRTDPTNALKTFCCPVLEAETEIQSSLRRFQKSIYCRGSLAAELNLHAQLVAQGLKTER